MIPCTRLGLGGFEGRADWPAAQQDGVGECRSQANLGPLGSSGFLGYTAEDPPDLSVLICKMGTAPALPLM